MNTEMLDALPELLNRLTAVLDELTAVQKDVAAAVHEDDLMRLGECMKKEQALSLSLRNIDQKRLSLQQQMGLEKITLSDLPGQIASMELREKVKAAAERLAAQYRIMQSAAEVARSALECSLHQVENMIANLGLDPEHVKDHTITTSGTHTDFHA